MFKGTLDNWESFLNGLPPIPYDQKATDIVFVKRKCDKSFDPMVHGNPPIGDGAWQISNLWEYLSGNQLGWTWHLDLKVVYSSQTSIPGAIALPPESVGGFKGSYCVEQKEWLTDSKETRLRFKTFQLKPTL